MIRSDSRTATSGERRRLVVVLIAALMLTAGTVLVVWRLGVLEPPQVAEAGGGEIRVAWIGDSYAQGAGAAGTPDFVDRIDSRFGWQAANLSAGGTGYVVRGDQPAEQAQGACGLDYCPSYREQIDLAVSAAPDIVIVSGGRNDLGSEVEELGSSVVAFYTELRQALPDADVIALSPFWDASQPPLKLTTLATLVERAVNDVGGTYVDLGQPLRGDPSLISEDGVHPNARGHEALALAIERALSSEGLAGTTVTGS